MNPGLGHCVRCQGERGNESELRIRDQGGSQIVKAWASTGGRRFGRAKSGWGFATDEMSGVHLWVSLATKETQGIIRGSSSYDPATIPSNARSGRVVHVMPASERMASGVGFFSVFSGGSCMGTHRK